MNLTKTEVCIKQNDKYIRILMPDSLGIDESKQIQHEVESKLDLKKAQIVVDLSDTASLYSPGIGLLIRLRKIITESEGAIYLVNVSKKLRDLLAGLNLDKIFSIFATDVEFEMSQKDLWAQKSTTTVPFLFVAQLEDSIYRINISGHMSSVYDLSSIQSFCPDKSTIKYSINMENLDLIDTYGIQILNDFLTKINNPGLKCAIFGANKNIQELIIMLLPQKRVTFYETEKDALESMRGK